MPLPDSLGLIESLAYALDEAHSKSIVHRDVKPANVLVERIGRRDYPKLIDWGISKYRTVSPSTAPGSLLGTPSFMSPEQTRGDDVTPATDIHALGALLYFCLTGRVLFEGNRLHEILDDVARAPRPELPDVGAGALHGGLERLYLSMVAIEPARRPVSALAVAEELRRIHGYLSPGSVGHHVDHTIEMPTAHPLAPTAGDGYPVSRPLVLDSPTTTASAGSPDTATDPSPRQPTAELAAMVRGRGPSTGRLALLLGALVGLAALVVASIR
jgi:serine/threonine-protein kinase